MTLLDSIHPVVVLILGLIGVLMLSRAARSRVAANFILTGGSRGKSAKSNSAMMQMLSARQKEIVRGAETLVKNGEPAEAARMFEGLGLHQKAVQAFIQAKMFQDACKILAETGSSDRAGYMMGAAGEWQEAIKHFAAAGMFGEAARCLEQLDRTGEAAGQWERAGNPREAARCYAAGGQMERAGRLFVATGKLDEAAACYDTALTKTSNIDIDSAEAQALTEFLASTTDVDLFARLRGFLSNPGSKKSAAKSQSVA